MRYDINKRVYKDCDINTLGLRQLRNYMTATHFTNKFTQQYRINWK